MTVGAIIVRKRRVLLVLHTKLNLWLFPGGHVEKNETPDDAVIREVKEETGLEFLPGDYGPIEYSSDTIKRLALPFHANLHSVGSHNHYCLYYLGHVDSDEVTLSAESKDSNWFNVKEISEIDNMPDNVRKMARYALSL